MPVVTEVMEASEIRRASEIADMIQIGARNMQNFPLLKEAGKINKPVMLKRGLNATIDEWLNAAEYILSEGNMQVILCERGIRTFETATRSTLDLSAVPVLRERTHLPVIVDPSHASGVWQYINDLSVAAMAVGSHAVMVEVHPNPSEALSDGPQALTFPVFEDLMESRGTKFHPGVNVQRGGDDTLFATAEGTVRFVRGRGNRKFVHVDPAATA